MTYAVKELFHTLQGEGGNTGRSAVFCRFAGCNLWSGTERDRARAVCRFCDTDFVGTDGVGGGRFATADALANAVADCWQANTEANSSRFVVFTGGEPLLQLDQSLVDAVHARGFKVAVETNGTLPLPQHVDWVCVSPKADAPLLLTSGDELKLVFPQRGADPDKFEHLNFDLFFLQPMDGSALRQNTEAAIQFCKRNPRWRLSIQTHKMLGIA